MFPIFVHGGETCQCNSFQRSTLLIEIIDHGQSLTHCLSVIDLCAAKMAILDRDSHAISNVFRIDFELSVESLRH